MLPFPWAQLPTVLLPEVVPLSSQSLSLMPHTVGRNMQLQRGMSAFRITILRRGRPRPIHRGLIPAVDTILHTIPRNPPYPPPPPIIILLAVTSIPDILYILTTAHSIVLKIPPPTLWVRDLGRGNGHISTIHHTSRAKPLTRTNTTHACILVPQILIPSTWRGRPG